MPSNIDKVKAVFMEAIGRAVPEEREAYLAQACGDDVELRHDVEELLKVHDAAKDSERSQSVEETPNEDAARFIADDTPVGARASSHSKDLLPTGEIDGRYRIIEVLGEGGMGIVCLAQQFAPVRRRVALKVIKLGMDSRRVLSRFEAERQALALLDHPNIAKVFDGGITADGRPYFAMEYVMGVPLTEYCDSNRLTIRERLALFLQLCKAVQHAHQKGIIHRDLKPSNILVANYDDKAVVKVIDFGLAKALHQPLTDFSQFTPHGTAVGTAMYMSPEQAVFNNLDIDTRTDIYSLGVILYELLTGTTPLERQRYKQAAWEEVLRIIREEEPIRPSTKLSSTGELPSIAAQRRTEPIKLNRMLRGELDWIAMKALEKERNRRYDTAGNLAQDIQHYLDEEPVSASPPSAWYRFRKFARRKKGTVAAVGLLVASLVVGVIGTTWGMVRAQSAEKQAKLDAQRSMAMEQLLLHDIIAQGDPRERLQNLPAPDFADITVRMLLERSAQQVEERFEQVPQQEAEVRLVLGKAFRGLGAYPQAETQLTRAVELFRSQSLDQPDRLFEAEEELGNVLRLFEPERAVPHFRTLYDESVRTYGADDARTLRIQAQLGSAMQANQDFQGAIEVQRQVLLQQERLLGPHHADVINTKDVIASLELNLGNLEAARTGIEEVLRGQRATLSENDPAIAITLNNLGEVLRKQAIQVVATDKARGGALLQQAVESFDESLRIMEHALGKEHPSYLVTQVNLGVVDLYLRKLDEAAQIYDEVLPKLKTLFPPHHEFVLAAKANAAAVWEAQGDWERAEQMRIEIYETARSAYDPEHMFVVATQKQLQAFRDRRKQAEATEEPNGTEPATTTTPPLPADNGS